MIYQKLKEEFKILLVLVVLLFLEPLQEFLRLSRFNEQRIDILNDFCTIDLVNPRAATHLQEVNRRGPHTSISSTHF